MPIARPRNAVRALAALALAVAVVASGCGGDPPPAPAAAPAATEAPAAQTEAAPQPQVPIQAAPDDPAPDDPAQAQEPEPAPPTSPPAVVAATVVAPGPVELRPAFGGVRFASPLDLTWLPDGRALVVEQDGRLLIVEPDGSAVTTALDLGDRVVAGGEQGLLSVTLDPGFADNGHVWIYYTRAPDGASRLSRVRLAGSAVAAGSELIVLETPQPYRNHNGGTVRFGPDDLLYLGLGDGGAAADPHGHGQNLGTLLGSMLRIYVAEASAAEPYRIPADNPFVGAAEARWEIYAYGLRNPWRMAFDPATGLLWTGDVGQNRWEEVDVIVAGGNYGWAAREGVECFAAAECAVAGEELPIWVYGRDEGCSISGGVVYRGDGIPGLAGAYVFGDYCSGQIWGLDAARGGDAFPLLATDLRITSFAADGRGGLFVLAQDAAIQQVVPLE